MAETQLYVHFIPGKEAQIEGKPWIIHSRKGCFKVGRVEFETVAGMTTAEKAPEIGSPEAVCKCGVSNHHLAMLGIVKVTKKNIPLFGERSVGIIRREDDEDADTEVNAKLFRERVAALQKDLTQSEKLSKLGKQRAERLDAQLTKVQAKLSEANKESDAKSETVSQLEHQLHALQQTAASRNRDMAQLMETVKALRAQGSGGGSGLASQGNMPEALGRYKRKCEELKKELKGERAARKEQVAALEDSLRKVMSAAIDTGEPPPPPGVKTPLEQLRNNLLSQGGLEESIQHISSVPPAGGETVARSDSHCAISRSITPDDAMISTGRTCIEGSTAPTGGAVQPPAVGAGCSPAQMALGGSRADTPACAAYRSSGAARISWAAQTTNLGTPTHGGPQSTPSSARTETYVEGGTVAGAVDCIKNLQVTLQAGTLQLQSSGTLAGNPAEAAVVLGAVDSAGVDAQDCAGVSRCANTAAQDQAATVEHTSATAPPGFIPGPTPSASQSHPLHGTAWTNPEQVVVDPAKELPSQHHQSTMMENTTRSMSCRHVSSSISPSSQNQVYEGSLQQVDGGMNFQHGFDRNNNYPGGGGPLAEYTSVTCRPREDQYLGCANIPAAHQSYLRTMQSRPRELAVPPVTSLSALAAQQSPMMVPPGKLGLPVMPIPRKYYQVKRTIPHAGIGMTASQIQAQRGILMMHQQQGFHAQRIQYQSWHGQAGHGFTNIKELPAVLNGAQLTTPAGTAGLAKIRAASLPPSNCRTANPFKQPMKQEYRSTPTFSY